MTQSDGSRGEGLARAYSTPVDPIPSQLFRAVTDEPTFPNSEQFSRSVNRVHDPYKLPIGLSTCITVFMLVIAPLTEDFGTKLALALVVLCQWVTLGILALCNHPGRQ